MATTRKEIKVKLSATHDELGYIAGKLGINKTEADALRTYNGIDIDPASPLKTVTAKGLDKLQAELSGMINKTGLDKACKERCVKAVEAQFADVVEGLLSVTWQNVAHCALVKLPRIESSAPAKKAGTVEEVGGI